MKTLMHTRMHACPPTPPTGTHMLRTAKTRTKQEEQSEKTPWGCRAALDIFCFVEELRWYAGLFSLTVRRHE